MEEEWSNKGNLGIIGYPHGEIAISPNLEGGIVSTRIFFGQHLHVGNSFS
jgi:hypothetical protein